MSKYINWFDAQTWPEIFHDTTMVFAVIVLIIAGVVGLIMWIMMPNQKQRKQAKWRKN